MIHFALNNNRNSLILFVHGFTGGKETWRNQQHGYFYDILGQMPDVQENFDIATFEYFTTLTNLYATTTSTIGKLKSLFQSYSTKSKKNIGIEEISELLRTQIRFTLSSYEHIVVISHSMGGLVTKASLIKDHEDENRNRIKLFISLAVPHLGADLATFGKLISNNQQIKDLAPLSELCPQLNNQWVKISQRPPIKYFYGTYDNVVVKQSAIGTDDLNQDVIACDDDHLSICKPAGPASIMITAVCKFLEEFISGENGEKTLEVKKLIQADQFDDEYFVLKLILADVHNATVNHAKEHFLNAEYARKLFSSASDQRKLRELYTKIRSLYQDSYDKFLSKGTGNSGELVGEIHDKIVREDSAYLKTGLPLIHALHKKGMLHQLANELNEDIWWGENKSIAALESVKATLAAA